MKKHKTVGLTVLALFVVAAIGLGAWAVLDHNKYAGMVAKASDVPKWEADPRPLQDKETTRNLVSAHFDNNEGKGKTDDISYGTVVIPGLRGAWSINAKTKRAGFGTGWVPQGVSQSDDYYYISMYDYHHRLNSIIVMIDKKTKKYEKTLILKSRAHVGAITYDRKNQRLFFSDDKNGKTAGISYLEQDYIDGYQAGKQQTPVESTRIEWGIGTRTSAFTVYKNQFVVAKYGQGANRRSIVAVPLDKEGLPQRLTKTMIEQDLEGEDLAEAKKNPIDAAMTTLIKKGVVNSYNPGFDRMQGIAIAENGLTLVSQSNGFYSAGKILVRQANGDGWSKLSFVKPTSGATLVEVPHSVEEISFSEKDRSLAVIFESGARPYREKGFFMRRPSIMDRFITLDVEE